jgi:peptidoglycan/LPS O-acetylase OafA/YrhL
MRVKELNFNFISIDILRGFAASMVFFYHYGLGKVLAEKTDINLFKVIDLIGSTYAVPLFFLISGFCIHLSQLKQNHYKNSEQLNSLTYFKRRFWRIYPIYFIVLLFSCTVMAMQGDKIKTEDFFVHLFVLQGFSVTYFNSINLVLWTITIEICFYILYPLWYYIRTKGGG